MMRLSLSEIARLTGGDLAGGDAVCQGMSHDTRSLEPGNLFLALPGERVDGHEYVAAAARAGAAGALVARRVEADLGQIVVEDVLRAAGALAAAWRARMPATVVGITGSNGKTTVKEMLAAILRRQAPTLVNAGNYNNELGLPLSLARLDASHTFAVLEMGACRAGDIAYLCELAAPRVGLVNNAGPAHLESFGSVEGVARAKGEIYGGLPEDGTAVINADDAFAGLWRKMAGARRVLAFGFGVDCDVRPDGDGPPWTFVTPAGETRVDLQLPGRHNVANALAATACAVALDMPLEVIARGLSEFRGVAGRLMQTTTAGGWTVIDDTYNANPASLYAGMTVLAETSGEAWLVLGDMAELGVTSDKLHAEVGRAAADMGIRRLFGLGPHSAAAVQAFGTGGRHFDNRERLIEVLRDDLHPGVRCLVKGSRSMGMEQVVSALTGGRD